MEKIFDNVLCLTGSVRCGVLISEGAAVLIDAPELPDGKRLLQVLAAYGVRYEAILDALEGLSA